MSGSFSTTRWYQKCIDTFQCVLICQKFQIPSLTDTQQSVRTQTICWACGSHGGNHKASTVCWLATLYFRESRMFRKNIFLPSSGQKCKLHTRRADVGSNMASSAGSELHGRLYNLHTWNVDVREFNENEFESHKECTRHIPMIHLALKL
jgi:hypothetical protein